MNPEPDPGPNYTRPEILPGSINTTGLEHALKIEDKTQRLDAIFETCLHATPYGDTAPTFPRAKLESTLEAVKKLDELQAQAQNEKHRATHNQNESLRRLNKIIEKFGVEMAAKIERSNKNTDTANARLAETRQKQLDLIAKALGVKPEDLARTVEMTDLLEKHKRIKDPDQGTQAAKEGNLQTTLDVLLSGPGLANIPVPEDVGLLPKIPELKAAELKVPPDPEPAEKGRENESKFKRVNSSHIIAWHLKNANGMPAEKRNVLLQAIAETAVEVSNTASLAKTILDASRDGSLEAGMNALLKICKGNEWATKGVRFKGVVLDELERHIREDFRANEMNGKATPRAHKAIVEVLAEIRGKRAVELIARIAEDAYLPEPKMKAVEALKNVGEDSPAVAVRTLKRWEFGEKREKATDAIVTAITAHADIKYDGPRMFWRDVSAVLQDEGLGNRAIRKIGKEVKREGITSLSGMAKMAVGKMGFGHPIWNRRAAGVLSAARNTLVQVEQMESPVRGGKVLVTERKTPIHRRAAMK